MPPKESDAQKPASSSPPVPAAPVPPASAPTPPTQEAPSALDKKADAAAAKAEAAQAKADDLAEQAQDAAEAAEDEEIGGKVRRCPHCRTPLVKHDDSNPHKAGCWHCDGCGTCWAPGIKRPRAGTPAPAGWKE